MSAGLFVGLSTLDIAYLVSALPSANQKIPAQQQEVCAGGPATNAAVTFSFLGGDAHLVTAIGAHALANVIRADLDRTGVTLDDIAATHDESPPVSSALVHAGTGERAVVSANAAAWIDLEYSFDPAWLSGMDILLIDGHYMPLAISAAAAARHSGIPVVLDGGSWKSGTDALLQHVDIAICSADFAPPEGGDALHYLRDRGVPVAVITRGADPILWQSAGDAGAIPVPRITPVDTLGAGDIFHGAFCRAYAGGLSIEQSLSMAADVASASCLHFGTRRWMKSDNTYL